MFFFILFDEIKILNKLFLGHFRLLKPQRGVSEIDVEFLSIK
jgi:hypothetical protein